MKNILLILSFCIASTLVLFGQENPDPCRKSTEGTDFWFGFMESRWHSNNHKLEITVTAKEATTFEIFYGTENIPLANNPISVSANGQITILIDDELVEAKGSEIIENKGIHLISKKPVNVYALNYDRHSSDVAVIYPTKSLGTEYFAMCYTPNVNGRTGKNSEFLIVAVVDSTIIQITPSVETDLLKPADSLFTIILNKGQVYQVQSMNEDGSSYVNQGDLTGSHLISDKPFALFSGSYGTTIPATQDTRAWDHLYEQISPVHSWGRKFYTVPLIPRKGDIYRILAAEDDTKVIINNSPVPIILNSGEFHEILLSDNNPSYIFADKKILVAQFSRSMSADAGTVGDPFMIILSPSTQVVNDVTFVAYNSDVITEWYVNIVARTEETSQILLDGNSIQKHFKPYSNSDYSYAQISLDPKTYHIWGENEKIGFLAYVYGFGDIESYGYGVGFNLDLTLDLGESIDFDGDTLLLCHGSSVELDAGPYFDTYYWSTGETTQKITVTKQDKYSIKTTTTDGCNLEDSIFVLVSHPEVDLEIEDDYDEGCFPHSIELNGNDGFEKYVWQNQNNDTLWTEQIFVADQTGEYRITVYDEYNCSARDTMNLVVFPVPKTKVEGETLICGKKTSELSVLITEAPEDIWDYEGSFTWSSNKPAELTFSEETHTSAKIEVIEWGEFEIYYHLVTSDGCISSDTFLVRFHQIPTSDFDYVDNPDAECEGYYREVLYVGNATQNANYYWDYGGSKVIDSIDWNRFTVSLGAYNSKPFLQLYVEEDGCWSDTTIKPLGANPDFILETENARGCDSITVLFKGTLGVEDSLLFEWDFGDGSPISNLQEVEHFYSDIGYYDVSLLITNILSGCQIGFQIDSMIKVFPTPTADITADASLCYPDSANIFYTHNIDSSICYWDFEGAHQSGNGNDSITVVLDEPFGKAILTVDEYGCFSEPVETQLKRKPHFDFYTQNEEGCQPYSFEVFADPKDNMLNFRWLNDSLPLPNGGSNIYTLPDSGRFDIGLIANSQETGCFDTLTKADWIWVHPKPIAAFEVDYPVALIEHAEISFFNQSEFATQYSWDFGDNTNSVEINPKHTYLELGDFNSQLFVESDYGCKDTTELLIKILPFTVSTPNAFRPDSEIEGNRTFMPMGAGVDFSRFYLKIYDRWGQIVFETKTPEHPWDGTTKNDTPAPMGNYVWISHYFDIQGFEHNQKGQILLVR